MKRLYRPHEGSSNHFAVIVSVLVMLMAAVAAGAGQRMVGHIRTGVRRTTIQVISELTDNKAMMLNGVLREAESDVAVLAEYLGSMNEGGDSQELLERFQKSHNTEAVIILDAQGRYVYGNEHPLPDKILTSLREEVDRSRAVISDVYHLSGGKRCILFGAKIPGGGSVYAAIPVEALQRVYGESTYKEEGYSYIVELNGDIEIPPIRYSYEQIYDNIRFLLEADGNDEEKIQTFMEALAERRSGSVVFSSEGKQQMFCFKPLEVRDWQLVTVVPLGAVEADGAQIIRTSIGMAGIIVAVIVMTLGLCLSFYFLIRRNQRENTRFLGNVYQAISENIDTVIFILDDRTSQLDYIFENSRRLLGISPQEFLDSKKDSKGEGSFKTTILSLWQEKKSDSPSMEEIHVYNDRLQKDMWLKVLICPFLLGGAPKHIYAVTDITEEHKARENITAAVAAAEQASSAKSSFLANMSHDMRTPMNGIVGMTAIARRNLDDRERVEDCLHKIDISSAHLLNLINDVLDMSRIESGKLTFESQPFDLVQILEGLEHMLRPQCEDKRQTFTVSVKAAHTKLQGDSMHLSQILMNLLSNAIKFTPKEGSVTITAEEIKQGHGEFAWYRFTVADTGIGMSSRFIKTIFTPFEREEVEGVQRTEGTGLGMAIAKNLVTAMGGQIFVESTLGQGSVFTVELELLLQDPDRVENFLAEENLEAVSDCTGKRVLLAEDNDINREIASVLLQECKATVEEAVDGKQALDCFVKSQPGYYDVILMDIMMPVMNGYEAARAIRESGHPQARTIPIIAMTANAFAEDVKAARDAGMNAHIAKPVDIDMLYRTLAEVMDLKRDE